MLRDVALSLRSQLRSYDFIGRYGGEEFLALLPGCNSKTAAEITRRMCQTVAGNPVHLFDIEVPVTVSIGLSSTAEAGFDPGALIKAVDVGSVAQKRVGAIRSLPEEFTSGMSRKPSPGFDKSALSDRLSCCLFRLFLKP